MREPMPITRSVVPPEPVPDREMGEQRVGGGDHAVSHPPGRHRGLQQLGEFGHLRRRVLGAAAHHDHRPLRRTDRGDRPVECVLVDRRLGRRRSDHRARGRRPPPVDGGFDRDRARAARHHGVERRLDLGHRRRRVVEQLGVLRQLAEDGVLVGQLVEHAEAAALRERRDLADDPEDPGVRPVAARQRCGRVEHAGSGDDAERGRSAGDLSGAHRHVGGALFVPGDEGVDVVGVDEHVEEVVVLDAGQAVQRIAPRQSQGVDDVFSDRALRGLGIGHDIGLARAVRGGRPVGWHDGRCDAAPRTRRRVR